MTMRNLPTRDGFTLIELLIVVVIIGALATIATQMFWSAKDRGLRASIQTDLKSVSTQQELYYASHSRYASDPAALDMSFSPGVTLDITYSAANGWAGITEHLALPTARCGLLIGAAPVGSADPADV
jgi:prepilin-type N-terminal cleavage/methylation domain-containing protein